MAFFGGYAGNGLRLGVEFDMHKEVDEILSWNEGIGWNPIDITQQIIAGYASYKLSDKLEGLIYVDGCVSCSECGHSKCS